MNLRCKPGDLAIITREEPGCEANIGRMVRVSGPIATYAHCGPSWLITPITLEPWTYRVLGDGLRTVLSLPEDIDHPDSWMIPIRGQEDQPEAIAEEAV